MSIDRRLPNAPLVEVIAEIHWALAGDAQGPQHDPNWFKMAMQLEPALQARLPVVEHLQPAGLLVPLDVLGRSPILRFRPSTGAWPLAQLGQGIATINATPPYDGWDAVSDLLAFLLRTGRDASPLFAAVRPERLQLTYRDAFTEDHSISDFDDFFINQVPLVSGAGLNALSKAVGNYSNVGTCEIKATLPQLPNSIVSVRGSRGQVKSSPGPRQAAILDFVVSGSPQLKNLDVDAILSWFGQAHDIAWASFSALIPSTVMENLKRERAPHV